MTCPSCKGQLSKIWHPQRSFNTVQIASADWSCGICGQTFSKEQLRLPKLAVRTEPR